jgi:hypothetical protein
MKVPLVPGCHIHLSFSRPSGTEENSRVEVMNELTTKFQKLEEL